MNRLCHVDKIYISVTMLYVNLASLSKMLLRSGRRCSRARSASLNSFVIDSVVRFQKKQQSAVKSGGSLSLNTLSSSQISQTAAATVGQTKNVRWKKLHAHSLTASKFGDAYRAILSGSELRVGKFLENWLNRPNLQGIPAIEWGLGHEKQAILCYEELLHVRVQPTGLWLSPDGALGASPDGLVYGGEGIIEVKCPFSCRAAENWQDAVETGLIPPYLQFEDEEGEQVTLKKTSNYYHQVQGQLYMTGAKWCDFVVWTPGYMKISRIYPDRAWVKTVLPVLCDFARNCLPLCARDPVTGAVEGVSHVHFL